MVRVGTSVTYRKAFEIVLHRLPPQFDVGHPGVGRTVSAPGDGPFDPVAVAFEQGFDTTVVHVADPAVEPESARFVTCICAEADSLHAA